MRTRRGGRTAWPLAVAWAFAGALALSLAQPSAAAAQSECGPYISGGPNNPASGVLRGFSRVTLNFGVSAGVNAGFSMSFNVGVYDMEGRKDPIYVRCDDYTEWDIQ